MTTGPTYVYNCPICDNILKRGSLMSGNTIGEKIFSDGKRIAPMFPEIPNLTRCKKCKTIFWLNKLKEIGTYEEFTRYGPGGTEEWQKADRAEFLKLDEYLIAIKTGISENKEEELFIRQRIWWAFNDRFRNHLPNEVFGMINMFNDDEDEENWKVNLHELIKLLDQTDINDKIMFAELNRNLGNFEKCISIIESIDHENINWLKKKLLTECQKKNKYVISLN